MKTKLTLRKLVLPALLLAIFLHAAATALAQGTAFTYQGRLNNGGVPVTGLYDLTFSLWNALSGPSQVGGGITSIATPVSNGLFTVTLDFGANFPGADRWLEVTARTNGNGAYSTLTPRQKLTPSPYAVTASTAASLSGALAANQLSGTLSSTQLSGLYSGALTFSNAANNFTGNGAGLTSLNAGSLSSGTVADTRLSANVARRAGGNAFTGQQTMMSGNVGIGTTSPFTQLANTPDNIFGTDGYGLSDSSLGWTSSGFGYAAGFYNPSSGGAGDGVVIGIAGIGTENRILDLWSGAPSNSVMVVNGNGRVGIGITSPTATLAVANTFEVNGAAGRFSMNTTLAPFNDTVLLGYMTCTSTNSPQMRFQRGGDANFIDIGQDGSGNFVVEGNDTPRMVVGTDGRVGIGTTTPLAGLQVETVASVSAGSWSFFQEGTINTNSFSGSPNLAIYTSGAIGASTYYAFSDARIKNIIGVSSGEKDLNTLRAIEVTDYSYKDKVMNGNRLVKKVIAQQVESVYPPAVSKTTGVLPDIYQNATIKDGWVNLATDLEVGEHVKLVGESGQGIYPVLEIREGAFRTAFKTDTDKVFVFGREVEDFRNVDYEAIAMLNVSATQELNRRVEKQAAELAVRDGRIASLEKANQEFQQQLAAQKALASHLQAEFGTLQKTFARLADKSASGFALSRQ